MSEPVFLYVEDDDFSREVMDTLLTQVMAYTNVTIWHDSQNFERRIHQLGVVPDFIFLDIHVEPIDGFEMLEILKNDAAFSRSRIYALTASVMNEEIARLKTAGFDGVLGKPLDNRTFPQLMEKILDGQNVWHIS